MAPDDFPLRIHFHTWMKTMTLSAFWAAALRSSERDAAE